MKLKILLKRQIQKIQFNRFVLKSKLRKKILKVRTKLNSKNNQIDFKQIKKIPKKKKINNKNIGRILYTYDASHKLTH